MSREKVAFDPLMSMMSSESNPETATSGVNKGSSATEAETFRVLDTSKVTLKEKKAKPDSKAVASTTAAPASVETVGPAKGPEGASKGLGYGVSLWENTIPSGGEAVSILDALSSTTAKQSSAESNLFTTSAPARATGLSAASVTGRFKVSAEENDEAFGDLKVGQLMEKEDDASLDFGLFGKTNVVIGTKNAVITRQAMSKLSNDDLQVESVDLIAQLEAATVEKKSAPVSVFAAPSFLDEPVTAAGDGNVDMNDLDLSAYISQNSSAQGGLFD